MSEKKPFQVGLIRVLTSEDQDFVDMHGRVILDHFPGIEVESRCIPDQWEGIHSHELERIAVPKIVALAKEFRDKDMIIVSCADDPGVAEIREMAMQDLDRALLMSLQSTLRHVASGGGIPNRRTEEACRALEQSLQTNKQENTI